MKTEYVDGNLLKKSIIYAAMNLEKNKKIVDDLNVFPVPDGDTGTNMSLTMKYAAQEVENSLVTELSDISDIASSGALMGARGNSGVILSQLLRGFAKGCKEKDKLDLDNFSLALKNASDMAYKAVMKPTEGTILTIAREMSKYATDNYSKYTYLEEFLKDIIIHGKRVLDETPDMLPVLKEAGVVDAGGKGLIYIFEGFYKALIGEKIKEENNDISENIFFKDNINSIENITYSYCTEFIILSKNYEDNHKENLKDYLNSIGDSVIVVGDENKIKVHVHTDNPDKAIENGLKLGELTRIKIDNMKEQILESNKSKDKNKKEFGIISVVSGEGLKKLFNDVGVDEVIEGGQTMNPSTQDFLNKINNINADNIIILPNNSNIILAANQAKEISDKNIEVIPTKTIPQGITAQLAFSLDNNIKDNVKNMVESIEYVKTGQITFAVRDTQVNGKEIKKDDIIGIFDGEIISIGNEIYDVTSHLLKKIVDEESELITFYYGNNIRKEEIEEYSEELQEMYEDIDIEVYYGGQQLYYFIISVE